MSRVGQRWVGQTPVVSVVDLETAVLAQSGTTYDSANAQPSLIAEVPEPPSAAPASQSQPFVVPTAPSHQASHSQAFTSSLPSELQGAVTLLEEMRECLELAGDQGDTAAVWSAFGIATQLNDLEGDPRLNRAAALVIASREVLKAAEIAFAQPSLPLEKQRQIMDDVRRVAEELHRVARHVERVPEDALASEDREAVLRVLVAGIVDSAHTLNRAPAAVAYGQRYGQRSDISFANDKSPEADALRYMIHATDSTYALALSSARPLKTTDVARAVTADKGWLKAATYETLGLVEAQRRTLGELLHSQLPQMTSNLRPGDERWERPDSDAFVGEPIGGRPWFWQPLNGARKVGQAYDHNLRTAVGTLHELVAEAVKTQNDRPLVEGITLLRQWARADADPLEIRHLASLGRTLEGVLNKLEQETPATPVPPAVTGWLKGNLELVKATYWARTGELERARESWAKAREIAAKDVSAPGQFLYDEAVEQEALALSAAVIGNGYGRYPAAQAKTELRKFVAERVNDTSGSTETRLAAVLMAGEAIMADEGPKAARKFVNDQVANLGDGEPVQQEFRARVKAWEQTFEVGSLTAFRRVWVNETVPRGPGALRWARNCALVGALIGGVKGFQTAGRRGAAAGAISGLFAGSKVGIGTTLFWRAGAAVPPALSAGREGMTHLEGADERDDWRVLGTQGLYVAGLAPFPKRVKTGRFAVFAGLWVYDGYLDYRSEQKRPEGPARQRAQQQLVVGWAAVLTLMATGIALRKGITKSGAGGTKGGGPKGSSTDSSTVPPSRLPLDGLKGKVGLEAVHPAKDPLLALLRSPPASKPT